jgi:hypothetical protein
MSVLCVSFIWLLLIGFRVYLDNPAQSHPKVLNLITSAKILFQNKVIFTGFRKQNVEISFLARHHLPYYMIHA